MLLRNFDEWLIDAVFQPIADGVYTRSNMKYDAYSLAGFCDRLILICSVIVLATFHGNAFVVFFVVYVLFYIIYDILMRRQVENRERMAQHPEDGNLNRSYRRATRHLNILSILFLLTTFVVLVSLVGNENPETLKEGRVTIEETVTLTFSVLSVMCLVFCREYFIACNIPSEPESEAETK